MYFHPCCDERRVPRDIALDDGEYCCILCGRVLGKPFAWGDRRWGTYIVKRDWYDPRVYANKILNYLEGTQPNAPWGLVEKFRDEGIRSKVKLYKTLRGPMKKHFSFLWSEINNVPQLRFRGDDRRFLVHKICESKRSDPRRGRSHRRDYHRIIREVIRNHPHLRYVLPYLKPLSHPKSPPHLKSFF